MVGVMLQVFCICVLACACTVRLTEYVGSTIGAAQHFRPIGNDRSVTFRGILQKSFFPPRFHRGFYFIFILFRAAILDTIQLCATIRYAVRTIIVWSWNFTVNVRARA